MILEVVNLESPSHLQGISELPTHEAVVSALRNGVPVSVVVNLDQCTPEGDALATRGYSGVNITAFNISESGVLAFSYSHITISTVDQTPIQQIMRFFLYPNGACMLTVHVFNLPVMDLRRVSSYACEVSGGMRFYSKNLSQNAEGSSF